MRNYLFYRFLVFSVLLVSSLTFATPRIIIKNATLIDAVNPVRENMTIVLQGDVFPDRIDRIDQRCIFNDDSWRCKGQRTHQ
jgi:hypothetical protein